MGKSGIAGLIYTVIAAIYAAVALILVSEKNALFWLGFSITLFSCLLAAVITALSINKPSTVFPLKISIAAFCAMYAAVSIAISVLLGMILKVNVNIFITIHVICLALFAIIVLVMFIAKNRISKHIGNENSKVKQIQEIICEFEKIKNKLIGLESEPQKKADSLIDSILEDLHFSNFSAYADVSEIDAQILSMAQMLSAETDNLIEIQSDDITSFEENVKEIKKLIKDRNTQIKLSKSNI